jgi:DMSO/TMAO reductase YedYZ heme-binding membrane subunit
MNPRQALGILTFYLLPIILIALNIFLPQLNLLVTSGFIAEGLFIIIMFLKPIAVIFNSEKLRCLLPYRKEAGVAIFWLVLFHGVGLIFKYKIFDITRYLSLSSHIFYAALATIFIFILGITSNNFSMETLGPNWKRIQYLAYPALLLTLYHTARAAANMNKFYIIGGLFIVLKGIEWSICTRRACPLPQKTKNISNQQQLHPAYQSQGIRPR